SALLKLQAAGIDVRPLSGALEPRVAASEPAFEAALAAARDRRPVRFVYRTGGRSEPEERQVEPWGVVSWHGRWYLAGHDLVRGASRVFRLSRVVGDLVPDGPPGTVVVPDGVDLRAMVAVSGAEPVFAAATVRIRAQTCWALRRDATAVHPDPEHPGWDVLDVGYSDPERLADRVTGFGSDVVVLTPPEARQAVIRRLTASAGAP
ncbi:MAG: transcriptional regulator protein-like protein, partial [Frankiales bacterium]|nr:transcriptional regulator protein-like protein [Frankiales bacterium]